MIPKKLADLVEEISKLPDRELHGDLLIEYAEKYTPVPCSIAQQPYSARNKVPGCESQAYVWCVKGAGGACKFYFAIDNPQGISAKSMAAILDETLSGQTAENIAKVPEDIVLKIFGEHITMARGQGLMSMVAMVKALAAEKASDTNALCAPQS